MALSEFDLISRYLSSPGPGRGDVLLGVGDDCALLRVPNGVDLAVSIDTMVEGVHFSTGTAPDSLGHKALAVSLSDLAAMGAVPAWATLALTLPRSEERWISAFARGFLELADIHGVSLIGGDTTRGPLSITVQVHGFVEPGRALRRDGARTGDLVAVSGTLGDAGLALQRDHDAGEYRDCLRNRLDRPEPRVRLGLALAGVASAAIDVSDGLVADLGHVCSRSGVAARLDVERLPLSPAVWGYVKNQDDWSLPLTAGDDYELCFTVPPQRRDLAEKRAADSGCTLTWIGRIQSGSGIHCYGRDGRQLDLAVSGFDHFR